MGVTIGVGEDYLEEHGRKVEMKGRRAGGMTKAVGRWALRRPEIMRTVWKGAMVPGLTFGQEILCMDKKVEREMDRVQREVGLRAMGGSGQVAQEGLEG